MGLYMICVHVKLPMYSSNISLVTTIQSATEEKLNLITVVILHSIIRCNRSCKCLEDSLSYTISGSYNNCR